MNFCFLKSNMCNCVFLNGHILIVVLMKYNIYKIFKNRLF